MQRNAPGWRLDKSTGRSLVGRTPHCIATVTYDPERRHSAPDLRPCNWIGQRKLGRFQDCKQPVLWHRSLRRSDPQRQDCMRIAQRRTGTFPHRTESGCSNPDSPRTILHSLVGSHLPHLRQNLDCRYLRHRGSDWFALCRSRRSPDPHHRMHPGRRRVGTYPRRIAVERLHPSLRHRTPDPPHHRRRSCSSPGRYRVCIGSGTSIRGWPCSGRARWLCRSFALCSLGRIRLDMVSGWRHHPYRHSILPERHRRRSVQWTTDRFRAGTGSVRSLRHLTRRSLRKHWCTRRRWYSAGRCQRNTGPDLLQQDQPHAIQDWMRCRWWRLWIF